MFDQLMVFPAAVDQPDGTVGHTVSRQMLFPVIGIRCDLASHRHLLVGHLVQTVDEVHMSAIVEKQGLVITSASTGDLEVKAARGHNLLGGDIEQGDAILADDQQRFAVVQRLQAEGLIDIFNNYDTRLLAVGNDQLTGITDGIDLPVGGCIQIVEPIRLIAHQPTGLHLFPLDLMTEDLTKGAHRQQTMITRGDSQA